MINKVTLIGNVGADPEIRTLEGGAKVARVRLATTERIYNRQTQEARDHTEWHTITLWRNLADVADRFIKKGSQIYIEGRIRSREWTDNAGAKRFSIEILADELKLLGRWPEGGQSPGDSFGSQSPSTQYQRPERGPAPSTQPVVPDPSDDIDDLPF